MLFPRRSRQSPPRATCPGSQMDMLCHTEGRDVGSTRPRGPSIGGGGCRAGAVLPRTLVCALNRTPGYVV